jgi:membrane protein
MSNESGLAARAMSLIWDTDRSADPRWKGPVIHVARIAFVIVRDIVQGRLTLHAMSLVYTTLLSIVPVLAIGFSVLKGFGVHNEIEPMLASFLRPLGEQGAEITAKVIEFVDNTQVGVLGFLGLALLIYTVISLIQKIESAFNDTWHVSQARSFARRFTDYLSVILIGPVLVFSAMGVQAGLMRHRLVTDLSGYAPVGSMIETLGHITPNILVVVAFTFVYMFVPNTKVRLGPAFIGGLISGLLWVTAGWAFASFVVTSVKYTAIYSAFATVIFAMIWLYVSWLILLVGGSIAFYVQQPEYLRADPGPIRLSNRVRERVALQITSQIARTYYEGGEPWALLPLTKRLRLPREAAERVLQSLEENDLVVRTSDEPPCFIPARPPEETEVKAVLDAVRFAGEDGQFSVERVPAAPAVKRLMDDADTAVADALRGCTLKQLALGDGDGTASET